MMGDFGLIWLESRLRISAHADDKPAHKVTVNSFSISKYKTTYAEYDVFTDAMKKRRLNADIDKGVYRYPTIPAGVYWQEAKDYCQWLGKITAEPFDLPFEAEWEYAGRSREEFFMMSTDDGNIDEGWNIATADCAQAELRLPLALLRGRRWQTTPRSANARAMAAVPSVEASSKTMISLFGRVCASAAFSVSAITPSALCAGIMIETSGTGFPCIARASKPE